MASKLTQKIVCGLEAPTHGNRIEYDAEVKGFGCRVTAAGAKSFVLNYRTRSGRERRFTIGKLPAWTVTAARDEAKRLSRRIADGQDPLGKRVEDRAAPTVADLTERYIEEHLPTKRPSSQREDRAMLAKIVLPELKHLKVVEIEHGDISALHRKITKDGHPYRANRVLALLSKMFSLAVFPWKMRAENPCKGVKRNPEEGRERYLESDEIARLMKALAEHEDQESANAIMLALLTGARRGELLKATWEQFNLAEGVWTKPSAHTKRNKIHRVPLSAPAMQLLTTMREKAPEQTQLFPGRVNASGGVDIRRPWEQVCLAAGLATRGKNGRIKPSIRFHDLRHSYASLLVGSGLSLPIIGTLLGHTQAQTTQRYAHLADAPLREATERVGKIVSGGKS